MDPYCQVCSDMPLKLSSSCPVHTCWAPWRGWRFYRGQGGGEQRAQGMMRKKRPWSPGSAHLPSSLGQPWGPDWESAERALGHCFPGSIRNRAQPDTLEVRLSLGRSREKRIQGLWRFSVWFVCSWLFTCPPLSIPLWIKKKKEYIYIKLSHFAVHLKMTQSCKSTVRQ